MNRSKEIEAVLWLHRMAIKNIDNQLSPQCKQVIYNTEYLIHLLLEENKELNQTIDIICKEEASAS